MSKLNDSEKKLEAIIQKERDLRSQELFGKDEWELNIGEVQLLEEYLRDLKNPVWKRVVYKGKELEYEISNTGQIRNMKSMVIRKPIEVWSGYSKINVYDKKICYTIMIHRLVAEAFIPNPDNLPVVNHKNGKKTMNWYRNLEWRTYQENTQHAISSGLAGRVGMNNPNNKYSVDTIHMVCKMLEDGIGPAEIAKRTGVSITLPENIKRRKLWTEISSQYNIPETVNITRPQDLKDYMIELIYAGYSNREIVQAAGLPDTEHEREYVGLFRRRLLRKST